MLRLIQDLEKRKMVSSVYIHIPFCNSICSYCDFCKIFYNEKYVNSYLDSLEFEIKSKYKGEIIKTIYIGGGSPSALTLLELKKIFSIIKIFRLDKEYEFTIELNVDDITREKLELLKDNGVNRISIGVETINQKYLDLINRKYTKKEVINNISLAKEYFDNINLDLMYAFPNETLDEVYSDLEFITSFNTNHLSIYSLIIEEHTKLFIDNVQAIDDELESSMYYNIIKYLNSLGYNHYEISNFAKDGYASIHNLVYWNNEEYYGFGMGSSGYLNKERYTNTRSINKYLNHDYLSTSEKIDINTDMENEMIFGLRKVVGVSKERFKGKYNYSIDQVFDIKKLIDNGLLVDDGNSIYIPHDKLYISNSILVNFIGGVKK